MEKTDKVVPAEKAKTAIRITGDGEYDRIVNAACTLVHKMSAQVVIFYWELGRLVKSATDGRTDGPRSVPQFMRHMEQVAPGRITLQKDSLYNAIDVYTKYTRDQVAIAQSGGVPLSTMLKAAAAPQEVRDNIIKGVQSGTYTPSQLPGIIKDQVEKRRESGDAPPPSEGQTKGAATRKVTRAAERITAAADTFSGYADALDVLCTCATKEDEIDQIQKAVAGTKQAFADFVKVGEAQLKLADRVLDRTITNMSREERRGEKAKTKKK